MSEIARFEINGVVVKQYAADGGPEWKWRVSAREGYTIHYAIQWIEAGHRWLRAISISDSEEEGGWQKYAVHYQRAYDEEEAGEVVRGLLERELGGG